MISTSHYWKTDLLKQSSALKKWVAQKRWTQTSFAKCEQSLMMGFYSVRKLVEAAKLTNIVTDRSFQILSYLPTGKPATLLNNHKIDELYDLDAPGQQSISLIDLCNQFIHSYVFSLVFDDDGTLSAVLVASDRQRSKALVEVPVATIIGLLELVGRDDVGSSHSTFDRKKGDYRVENRSFGGQHP